MLREEKSQDDIKNEYAKKKAIALNFLNSLRLEPWENKKYAMEYLATPKGKIIILLTDFELSIQKEVYDVLKQVLKTSEEFNYFINDFIRNKGLTLMFSRIDPSKYVGDIEDDDIPMTQNIQESVEKNPLKSYFFKLWDKQKREGKVPNIGNLQRLGLLKKRDEIILYFVEYMGYGDLNSRSEAIKNYLMNAQFDEDDITDIENFDQGKIELRFTKVDFKENDNEVNNYLELDVEFVVLSGSFYNSEEGETYHFSSGDNPFDDFVAYFEFKEEIEQVVGSFVFKVLESFGYDINRHFEYIDVKW